MCQENGHFHPLDSAKHQTPESTSSEVNKNFVAPNSPYQYQTLKQFNNFVITKTKVIIGGIEGYETLESI